MPHSVANWARHGEFVRCPAQNWHGTCWSDIRFARSLPSIKPGLNTPAKSSPPVWGKTWPATQTRSPSWVQVIRPNCPTKLKIQNIFKMIWGEWPKMHRKFRPSQSWPTKNINKKKIKLADLSQSNPFKNNLFFSNWVGLLNFGLSQARPTTCVVWAQLQPKWPHHNV